MADLLFYAPRWETLALWLFLWLPLAELAALCVLTLNNLPPQRRRGLFALFFAMLGLAAALFGGAALLDRCGLAWRTWFQEGLSAVLWLAGLSAGIITLVYAGRWLAERGKGMKNVVTGLSALCLASAMLSGTVLGGLWCMGPGEEVGMYQGQKVVQGKWTWLDTSYDIYEYYGPLVRGRDPIAWGEAPLIDGAVINGG